jgi:hypothetical protein
VLRKTPSTGLRRDPVALKNVPTRECRNRSYDNIHTKSSQQNKGKSNDFTFLTSSLSQL